MKYIYLFKRIDELTVDDFDDEILEQYKDVSIDGNNMIHRRLPDGNTYTESIDSFKAELVQKQMELFMNDLSDRVADKVIEKLREVR